MDLIKKLFSFNGDDTSAIGLCKFNDEFVATISAKEQMKKKANKEVNLTDMLKRSY